MAHKAPQTVECRICHKHVPAADAFPAAMVRQAVADAIKQEHADWTGEGYVCAADLNHFRMARVRQVVQDEIGALTDVEMGVVHSLESQDLLSRNVNEEYDQKVSFGEKVSDRMASFGGSWPFIFTFGAVLLTWIVINSVHLLSKPFDPFPFILLNLVLSCLAAIQAPVIMMSQNRQEAKDRLRLEHDYQVNLKAELEIRALAGRLDELLHHQWQGLLEIQQLQTEMMEHLAQEGGDRKA